MPIINMIRARSCGSPNAVFEWASSRLRGSTRREAEPRNRILASLAAIRREACSERRRRQEHFHTGPDGPTIGRNRRIGAGAVGSSGGVGGFRHGPPLYSCGADLRTSVDSLCPASPRLRSPTVIGGESLRAASPRFAIAAARLTASIVTPYEDLLRFVLETARPNPTAPAPNPQPVGQQMRYDLSPASAAHYQESPFLTAAMSCRGFWRGDSNIGWLHRARSHHLGRMGK